MDKRFEKILLIITQKDTNIKFDILCHLELFVNLFDVQNFIFDNVDSIGRGKLV